MHSEVHFRLGYWMNYKWMDGLMIQTVISVGRCNPHLPRWTRTCKVYYKALLIILLWVTGRLEEEVQGVMYPPSFLVKREWRMHPSLTNIHYFIHWLPVLNTPQSVDLEMLHALILTKAWHLYKLQNIRVMETLVILAIVIGGQHVWKKQMTIILCNIQMIQKRHKDCWHLCTTWHLMSGTLS